MPPVAVTMGDPAGIGPDIALQSWCLRDLHRLHPFAIYGDADVLRERARGLRLDVPVIGIDQVADATRVFADALPIVQLDSAGGRAAADRPSAADAVIAAAIVAATADVLGGKVLAMVTNPIAKRSLQAVDLPSPGHTAFLGQLAEQHTGTGPIRPVMMLAAPELRVVPATVHIPVSAVPRALTRTLILETTRITAHALVRDFAIPRPRIAIAGLNPHAGEEGLIGREEMDIIEPAIAELQVELAAEGISVTGPYSADSLFHAEARRNYDAAIAMYHDQALIPLKTLAFDAGVNVTLGLPFVRTSPDHGTAYAIAGTGKARPDSFIAALKLAAEMGLRRRNSESRSVNWE